MSTPNDPYDQQPQHGYGQQPQQQGYGQQPQQPYGAAPSYGSAPAAGGYGSAPGPVSRPSTVQNAVYLMYAGAALGIIGMLVSLLTLDSMRQQVEEQLAAQGGGPVDQSLVDTSVTIGIGVGVVFGLIGAGLWIMNAIFCGRGANWSRILSTVFAAILVLSSLFTFFQPGSGFTKAITGLTLVVGIAAVVLLWQRPSNEFFQQAGAARAAR